MTTELITMKLDDKFLKDIDSIVEKSNFHNRTEFIREALREKVDKIKYYDSMMSIIHLKGASKKKTTDEEFNKLREKISKEYFKDV